jgi:FkbM family methyltransferase
MPGLDRSPLPARELRDVASLLDRPIVAVDVGVRDGVRDSWRALGPNALLVGFDPDPEECARLSASAPGPARERYEPGALGASVGEATLHVTRDPQSSSLYEPSAAALRRYPELWRHEPQRSEQIALTTVEEWAAGANVGGLDALKVDVQGAELDVLKGAGGLLAGARIVETEVEFQELYSGQPLFCDVVAHLHEAGFELWRLRDLFHCGLEPPARGEPVFGVGDYVERTRLGGQLAWGNAVFVKGELADATIERDWQVRARDACLAAIFGFPELTELGLRLALAASPPPPAQEAIAAALKSLRRRGRARRLEDLFARAPAHVRGVVAARLSRRS